jgi:two-component system, chemotaxis family, protein-glutamate methylesterase/glutaminase
MTIHRIIAIGASAGGIQALKSIVARLPGDLPAIVCVVLHVASDSPGAMPGIITKAGPLAARHPVEAEALSPGRIYVAPPDHHLLVDPSGRCRLSRGAKENRFRPAIDPLLRSAAHACGPQVIGVVLSGALYDGTAGLWAVKRHGGVAVVQDPDDAAVPSMPLSALRNIAVDHCAPASEIGSLLTRLATAPVATRLLSGDARPMDLESHLLLREAGLGDEAWALGRPSPYVCPECHGILQEIGEGALVRYCCHVGHAYLADGLLAELTRRTAQSLARSMRAFQESAELLRQGRAGARASGRGDLREVASSGELGGREGETVRAVAMGQGPPSSRSKKVNGANEV